MTALQQLCGVAVMAVAMLIVISPGAAVAAGSSRTVAKAPAATSIRQCPQRTARQPSGPVRRKSQ
jgi:hypothetical protein